MKKYKIGDHVKVSPENDNENYNSFRNEELVVTHVATNENEHPGFDSALKGEALYDLATVEGTVIHCSLYDYELIKS
jgi:sulfite reductase alpha subunit-like flavoprotein